jgi:putative addiction module component (TIGR02574 family)
VNLTELEAEALKLDPASRARLAERLLESLETLSEQENQQVWLDEAARRDADLEADPSKGRPVEEVFRDARARLV